MSGTARIVGRATLVAFALVVVQALPVRADPAEPTDYRSTVERIEPDTDAVDVTVIGGDGFLRLRVERGHDVEVDGYQGEPWLRVHPDGVVEENRRSPASYLNGNRYGEAEIPEGVDADAQPEWRRVGDDGEHVWHDHRIHWMSPDRPPDRQAGDVVFPDWTIALTVDGTRTVVHGQLRWVRGVSPLPWVGAALGAAVGAYAVRRTRLGLAVVLLIGGVAATVVGIGHWLAVPPVAGGGPLLIVVPALGAVVAVIALARPASRWSPVAVLAGCATLSVWALSRVDVLRHPILPTDLPANLDRAGTALALGIAVGAAAAVVQAGVSLGGPRPLGQRRATE